MMLALEHFLQMKSCMKCQYIKQAEVGIALIEAGVPPTLPVPVQLTAHHGGNMCVWGGRGEIECVKQFKTIVLYYCQISCKEKKVEGS